MNKRNYRYVIFGIFSLLSQLRMSGQEALGIVILRPMDFYEKIMEVEDPVIIDTRSEAEFSDYRIPRAQSAPQRSVLFPILDKVAKDKPIFVYCDMGSKSGMVCKLIEDKGFKTVYHLKGGIRAWKRKDMPLDKKDVNE